MSVSPSDAHKNLDIPDLSFYHPDESVGDLVSLRIWSHTIYVGDQEANTHLMQVPLLWHR